MSADESEPRLRSCTTAELTDEEVAAIRDMLVTAFGPDGDEAFGDDDWEHALGGTHVVLDVAGRIVSHAAVVERELHVDGRPLRTGYVEAVATAPSAQGRGYGRRVIGAANSIVDEGFQLGALGTGRHAFYERLGWRTWRGPSSVRAPEGLRRTPDEDGFILVRLTPSSPSIDLTAPISCDWRPGDVW